MGDNALTDEQRALIEAKRIKAIENRNRNHLQLSDGTKPRYDALSMRPKNQEKNNLRYLQQSVTAPVR